MRLIVFLAVGMGILNNGFSQAIIYPETAGDGAPKVDSLSYLSQFGQHKKLPPGYELEALTALSHFPELKNVPVKFRVKKSYSTLKTRPTWGSMVMSKGHRTYVVTISNNTIEKLMPLTLENLPEHARIGIIGHELSHVADFSKKTTWQSFRTGAGHFSKHYMDSLEYHTDKICIEHGLGNELEAWSSYIRRTMHTTYWRGADFVNKENTHYERYMNPSTIEKYMAAERDLPDSTIKNAHRPIVGVDCAGH